MIALNNLIHGLRRMLILDLNIPVFIQDKRFMACPLSALFKVNMHVCNSNKYFLDNNLHAGQTSNSLKCKIVVNHSLLVFCCSGFWSF